MKKDDKLSFFVVLCCFSFLSIAFLLLMKFLFQRGIADIETFMLGAAALFLLFIILFFFLSILSHFKAPKMGGEKRIKINSINMELESQERWMAKNPSSLFSGFGEN